MRSLLAWLGLYIQKILTKREMINCQKFNFLLFLTINSVTTAVRELNETSQISLVTHDAKGEIRLVPHVDKAPLPLRIWRLVTSNFLQVENPTHPTALAPERASVYILGQFRTSKWEMNMYWKLRRFAALSFRYKAFQILLLLEISILIIFFNVIRFWCNRLTIPAQIAQVVALSLNEVRVQWSKPTHLIFFLPHMIFFQVENLRMLQKERLLTSKGVEKVHK